MRTTIILSDDLVAQARQLSGTERITDLLHAGLEALVQREARKRILAMGASDQAAWVPERDRGMLAAETAPPYRPSGAV